MFIYFKNIKAWMSRSAVWVRSGGAIVLLAGIALVVLSGQIVDLNIDGIGGGSARLMSRAGFAFALIGTFSLFLHSENLLPSAYVLSLARTGSMNIQRMTEAMNLSGKGTYIPPAGRLMDDRVFVPMDDRDLPLPQPSDGTVLNAGDLGPALGAFFVPPGKDLLDRLESDAGRSFSKAGTDEAQDYLEILTKGSGLIARIEHRTNADTVDIRIRHSRLSVPCDELWEAHPGFHAQVGCAGCSLVLVAAARISGSPLRIVKATREEGVVHYILRRF